jgi:hypothetical protein
VSNFAQGNDSRCSIYSEAIQLVIVVISAAVNGVPSAGGMRSVSIVELIRTLIFAFAATADGSVASSVSSTMKLCPVSAWWQGMQLRVMIA